MIARIDVEAVGIHSQVAGGMKRQDAKIRSRRTPASVRSIRKGERLPPHGRIRARRLSDSHTRSWGWS